MAGLSVSGSIIAPAAGNQLSAIVRLRWHLFANSLRTSRGATELASRIFIGLLVALGGLGGALGFGLAAFFIASQDRLLWIGALLWAVFVFWQVFPIMSTAFSENLDSSIFLRFPLSYRSYLLVTLLYGASAPNTAMGLLWLMGIGVGVGFAQPSLLPFTALVLAAFALVNIFLTRMIFAWIERWLAQRRTRELLGIFFFLMIVSFQFVGPIFSRYGDKPSPKLMRFGRVLSPVERALPPGLAAEALDRISHGSASAALGFLALECVYGLIFLSLLSVRLRAQYRGENLNEAIIVKSAGREIKTIHPGWRVPGFSAPVAAMFEKELRYLSRSGPMLFTLIMPVVMLLVFRLGPSSGRDEGFLKHTPNFSFPIGAAYAVLLLTNLVYNNFGNDGGGVQFYFALPVRFRQIVLAKNLAHLSVLGMELMLLWFGVYLLYEEPSLDITCVTIAGILFAAPANFAVGNLLSIYFPKKIDVGVFGRQRASPTTILASFAVQIVTFGVCALILLWSLSLHQHHGSTWPATLIFLALAAIAIAVYIWVLRRMDRIALKRRETLVLELCRS